MRINKNKKGKYFLIVLILFLIFVNLIYYFIFLDKSKEVCFESSCFEVELAITDLEKKEGLMFRESLDENKGMLFVFDFEDRYGFWMKNTLIPLDVIWISKDFEIVHIEENLDPCKNENICTTYGNIEKAMYVLEINAGKVKEFNINLGDKLVFHNII